MIFTGQHSVAAPTAATTQRVMVTSSSAPWTSSAAAATHSSETLPLNGSVTKRVASYNVIHPVSAAATTTAAEAALTENDELNSNRRPPEVHDWDDAEASDVHRGLTEVLSVSVEGTV